MKKNLWILIVVFSFISCSNSEKHETKEHYLIRGMNYSRSKQYTKAIEEYKAYYVQDKKNPLLLREMALAYAYLEDYKISEKYYLAALKLEPEDQGTISNIAILYYKMGDLKKSRKYLEKISSDSVDYKIYILKGNIAYDEKEYEDAYINFTKVLNLIDTSDYAFIDKYVEVLQKTKRTNEIYPFIYTAYQNHKDNPVSVIKYSRFLVDVFSDYEGSFKVLKEYLSNEKNDAVTLEIAKRSFEVGKVSESELYLKHLTDAYKYDIEVLKLKKEISQKQGKPEEAKKYQKIIDKVSDISGETNKDSSSGNTGKK